MSEINLNNCTLLTMELVTDSESQDISDKKGNGWR